MARELLITSLYGIKANKLPIRIISSLTEEIAFPLLASLGTCTFQIPTFDQNLALPNSHSRFPFRIVKTNDKTSSANLTKKR